MFASFVSFQMKSCKCRRDSKLCGGRTGLLKQPFHPAEKLSVLSWPLHWPLQKPHSLKCPCPCTKLSTSQSRARCQCKRHAAPTPMCLQNRTCPHTPPFLPFSSRKAQPYTSPAAGQWAQTQLAFGGENFHPMGEAPEAAQGAVKVLLRHMLCPLAQSKHSMPRGCCQNRAEAPEHISLAFLFTLKTIQGPFGPKPIVFSCAAPSTVAPGCLTLTERNRIYASRIAWAHDCTFQLLHAWQPTSTGKAQVQPSQTLHVSEKGRHSAVRDIFSLDRPWRPLSTVSRASPGNLARCGSPLALYSKCPLFLPYFSFPSLPFPSPFCFSFSLSLSHFLSFFSFSLSFHW